MAHNAVLSCRTDSFLYNSTKPQVPLLCQVYIVLVTRETIPMAVTFTDEKQQLDYECPVSLTALYRPVSINHR